MLWHCPRYQTKLFVVVILIVTLHSALQGDSHYQLFSSYILIIQNILIICYDHNPKELLGDIIKAQSL